jgi:hypothetical protein
MILRWFRDNFVSQDDIIHYYKVAPIIVEKLNSIPDSSKIYNWIYENVILVCVEAIKQGNYDFAYKRYRNSILVLEKTFVGKCFAPEYIKVKCLIKQK